MHPNNELEKNELTVIKFMLQIKVAVTGIPILVAFCITAVISVFFFRDHHSRKVFVGSVGLCSAIAMYGSPLVVVVSSPSLSLRISSLSEVFCVLYMGNYYDVVF